MASKDSPLGQRIPGSEMPTAVAAATHEALPFAQQAASSAGPGLKTTGKPKSHDEAEGGGVGGAPLPAVTTFDAASSVQASKIGVGPSPGGGLVPVAAGSGLSESVAIGIPRLSASLDVAQGAAIAGHAGAARTHSSEQLPGSLSPQGSHQCDICRRQFSSKHNLRSHKSVVHFGIRKHPCKICGRAFARGDRLTRHLETQHHIYGSRSRGRSSKGKHSESAAPAQQSEAAASTMMQDALLAATSASASADRASLPPTPRIGAGLAHQRMLTSGGAAIPPALPVPILQPAAGPEAAFAAPQAPPAPVACKLCSIMFPDADSAVRHLLVTHIDVGAVLTPNPLLGQVAQVPPPGPQLYHHHHHHQQQQQLLYEQHQQHLAHLAAQGHQSLEQVEGISPTSTTLSCKAGQNQLGSISGPASTGSPAYVPSHGQPVAGLDVLAAAVSTPASAAPTAPILPTTQPMVAAPSLMMPQDPMAADPTGMAGRFPAPAMDTFPPHVLESIRQQQQQQQLLHQQLLQQRQYELAAAQGVLQPGGHPQPMHAATLPRASPGSALPRAGTAPGLLTATSTSH